MSVLERCPSDRESNKGSKERQGPTLCVRFREVSVKRESTVESTPSKTDTFGTGSKCPSSRDVRLIESQIKGVKKGRDQL